MKFTILLIFVSILNFGLSGNASTPLCNDCPVVEELSGPPQPACIVTSEDCPKEIDEILKLLKTSEKMKIEKSSLKRAKTLVEQAVSNKKLLKFKDYLLNLNNWLQNQK